MVRISGIDLPSNKIIKISLTYIYGIGLTLAKNILNQAKVNPNKYAKDLTERDTATIREIIESSYKIEGNLRSTISLNIKKLIHLGCYKGIRHKKKLPVRGQRTHSNARTRRVKV